MSLQPERAKAQPDGTMGFMPFYYQRFAWSTRGWPAEAALAYIYLLCEQYAAGSIDPDPERLEEIAPGTVAHWDRIKRKFTVGEDGRLRNLRCEEIRNRSLAAGDRKRQQARNAAAMRWHSGSNADAMQIDANDIDNDNEIDNEIDSTQKANTIKRPRMPEGALERLWNLFPRKVGKARALILLERAIRDYAEEWELDGLDDAVEVFREHIDRMAKQYRNTEPQFVPHPATWLGQKRYLDPVPEEAR